MSIEITQLTEPENVAEYWVRYFGPDKLDTRFDELKSYPLESVCGVTCANIIDRAKFLLAACDSHHHVTDPIKYATYMAIQIVCFG